MEGVTRVRVAEYFCGVNSRVINLHSTVAPTLPNA